MSTATSATSPSCAACPSSSGGSGRARSFRLSNSSIALQVSSMASFRPDGALFEGRAVAPDAVVHSEPTDFIGQTDRVLDAALQKLR